jgi:hypothetical protein
MNRPGHHLAGVFRQPNESSVWSGGISAPNMTSHLTSGNRQLSGPLGVVLSQRMEPATQVLATSFGFDAPNAHASPGIFRLLDKPFEAWRVELLITSTRAGGTANSRWPSIAPIVFIATTAKGQVFGSFLRRGKWHGPYKTPSKAIAKLTSVAGMTLRVVCECAQ